MDQMSLALSWGARRTDNANSREAAQAATEFSSRHRSIIEQALREHGPMGRYAIARVTGLDPVAVARRLSELVADYTVRVVPDSRERTPTGRTGSVWEVMR